MNRKDYWFTVTGRNKAPQADCNERSSFHFYCFILALLRLCSAPQCLSFHPRLNPHHTRAALES